MEYLCQDRTGISSFWLPGSTRYCNTGARPPGPWMVGLFRGSQGQGSVCSLPAPPTVAKCPAFSSQGFARVPDCCLQDGWVRSFFRRRLEPGSFPSAPDPWTCWVFFSFPLQGLCFLLLSLHHSFQPLSSLPPASVSNTFTEQNKISCFDESPVERCSLSPRSAPVCLLESLFQRGCPQGNQRKSGKCAENKSINAWSNLPQDPRRCCPRLGLQQQRF